MCTEGQNITGGKGEVIIVERNVIKHLTQYRNSSFFYVFKDLTRWF